MNKVATLFAEESAVIFADGTVIKGATNVGGYITRVITSSFELGAKRGLKIGFVGGVLTTGCITLAALTYYKPKKLKE